MRDEYNLGHEITSNMKKTITIFPKKVGFLRHTLVMQNYCVTSLMQILTFLKKQLRRSGRILWSNSTSWSWYLGCSSKTWREFHSFFHVDLQDQACRRFQHQEIQRKVHGFSHKEGVDYGMTYSIDQTHFYSKVEMHVKYRTIFT